MIINKVKIHYEQSSFSIVLKNGINVIESSNNQFGKSTIIYAILYAFGAKKEVFGAMKVHPKLIEIYVDNNRISRSETSWICNGKNVNTANDISKHMSIKTHEVRTIGGFKEQDILSILQYMTLLQSRDDAAKESIYKGIISTTKSDTLSYIKGYNDYEKLLKINKDIDEIKRKNKKIRRTIKLSSYILNDNVNIMEKFDEHDKNIVELRKKVRATYAKQKKFSEMISEFEEQIDFTSSVTRFIDEVIKKANFSDLRKENELRKFLDMKFDLARTNSYSIDEIEEASSQISALNMERKELEEKISLLEEKVLEIIDSSGLEREIITYAISKKTDSDVIDSSELSKKALLLKNDREKYIAIMGKNIQKKLDEMDVTESSAGLGQVSKYIVERCFWKNDMRIPLIIDSANEVATPKNFNEKIIPALFDFKGQVIITTMKELNTNFEQNDKINLVKLENKIFE